jgi:hypothetical protein
VLKFFNRYRGGGPRYLPLGNALVSLPAAELTKQRPPTVMDPTIKELPRFVPVRGGSPIMWGSAVYESPSGEADAAAARERRDAQRGRRDKSDKNDKNDAKGEGPEDGEDGGKPGDGEGDEAGGTAPPTPPGGSATPSPSVAGGAVAATRPVAATAAGARRSAELFIYGWHVRDLNDQRKQMYLARVPKQRVADFSAWRFYAGAGLWARNQSGARPVQPPGQDFPVSTASSVIKINGRYWLIQHEPDLDDPDIVAYPALTPWGPFDPAQRLMLYQARSVGRVPANAFRIIYEARAMTALSTAKTLVIGYNLNTTAISTGCRSLSHHTDAIYRPQFLTVPMGDFPRAGPTRTRPRVRSGDGGNPPGTDIVARDPGQWFDAWRFSISACPPMPRIPAVQAVPAPGGTVALSWTGAGLDVAYRVYHREVGGKFYAARTLGATSVTLKGYRPGRTYEWRVVPVNVKGHEGPPTTVTARTP